MNKLKPLFFHETLRHWHFEAIVKESKLSRERVHHFLKKLQQEGYITRRKPKRKLPYYTANRSHKFCVEKRLYGLGMLAELFDHLLSCEDIKTAILFGSFARGNWGKASDINLFLYGHDAAFERAQFVQKLGREIQVFAYKDAREITLEPSVLLNGFHITKSIAPFELSISAVWKARKERTDYGRSVPTQNKLPSLPGSRSQ